MNTHSFIASALLHGPLLQCSKSPNEIFVLHFIVFKRWNGVWDVPQSSSNLFPLIFFWGLLVGGFFPLLFIVCFGSWPILSDLSHFYRILLMNCVQCCLGKTCHSDFSLFLKCVWFHLAAAGPFFHKRIWLLSVIKMNFSLYGELFFPTVNLTSTCFSEYQCNT